MLKSPPAASRLHPRLRSSAAGAGNSHRVHGRVCDRLVVPFGPQRDWIPLMDARQLFALGALGTGMLSLALQLTALCLGAEDAERYVFVRAANATAVLSLALLSAAFVF